MDPRVPVENLHGCRVCRGAGAVGVVGRGIGDEAVIDAIGLKEVERGVGYVVVDAYGAQGTLFGVGREVVKL